MVVAGVFVGLGLTNSAAKGPSAKRVSIASRLAAGTRASADASSTLKASPATRSVLIHPVVTPPMRSMAPAAASKKGWILRPEVNRAGEAVPGAHSGSALVQRSAPHGQMPSPIVNFEGVNNRNGAIPPDTEGDIGPNHYMQWVNLSFAVFDRTGNVLLAPRNGNTLFTGTTHCGASSGNGGDPIVVYDQFANRWVAGQLAYPTYPQGPFYQCVAMSMTPDPTGQWCAYEYVAAQTKLNDYPKFGVWPTQNAYMITVNQFNEPGDGWAGVGVFALERDQMLACNTTRMLYRDMFPIEPNLWGGMLPSDVDGTTLPPANAPNPLIEVDDDIWGFPEDRLDVWNATADWTGGGT